ncbi:hypothetical protein MP638_004912 [Amoeboaphelidium occidentale]|nr:hypothetical protein MP638_004912 [Amoeboaphelidium occidentale]
MLDPFYGALFYPLPVIGVSDYVGMLFLFYTIYLIVRTTLLNKDNNSLLEYVTFKKVISLDPSFPELSIPFEIYKNFSAKQLNAILVASAPVPPVELQYYHAPFHYHKQSIHFKPIDKDGFTENGIIFNDLELEVDVTMPCRLEIYAGVYVDRLESHGFGSDLPALVEARRREAKVKGKQKAIDVTSPKDEAYELDIRSPGNTAAWGYDSGKDSVCFFKETDVMFKKEMPLFPSKKKQTVTIECVPYLSAKYYSSQSPDSPFYLNLKNSDEVGNEENEKSKPRGEASISISSEQDLMTKHLRSLMKTNPSRPTIPYLLIMRPLGSTVFTYGAAQTKGTLDYSKVMSWLFVFGNIRKTDAGKETEPSANNSTQPDLPQQTTRREKHYVAFEYARELLYAPRIPIIPSMLGLSKTQEESFDLNEWWEIEEVFGALSSTASLKLNENAEQDPSQLPQCCVCLSDPAKVAILPCRHLCMCFHCYRAGDGSSKKVSGPPTLVMQQDSIKPGAMQTTVKWSGCPVCRSPVRSWIEMHDELPLSFQLSSLKSPMSAAYTPASPRLFVAQKSSARI